MAYDVHGMAVEVKGALPRDPLHRMNGPGISRYIALLATDNSYRELVSPRSKRTDSELFSRLICFHHGVHDSTKRGGYMEAHGWANEPAF